MIMISMMGYMYEVCILFCYHFESFARRTFTPKFWYLLETCIEILQTLLTKFVQHLPFEDLKSTTHFRFPFVDKREAKTNAYFWEIQILLALVGSHWGEGSASPGSSARPRRRMRSQTASYLEALLPRKFKLYSGWRAFPKVRDLEQHNSQVWAHILQMF
jgi:hypothetical protein